MTPDPSLQTASLTIRRSPLAIEASVAVTTQGLLAIATLVCGILLSAAVLVRAAKKG